MDHTCFLSTHSTHSNSLTCHRRQSTAAWPHCSLVPSHLPVAVIGCVHSSMLRSPQAVLRSLQRRSVLSRTLDPISPCLSLHCAAMAIDTRMHSLTGAVRYNVWVNQKPNRGQHVMQAAVGVNMVAAVFFFSQVQRWRLGTYDSRIDDLSVTDPSTVAAVRA